MKPSPRKVGCVCTDNYVGPLGLLLELIEQRGMDISQISLARVADQYLGYVEKEQIELAELADFLEIAARLVWIKSKVLTGLVLVETEAEEEEQEDLAQRLELYARFRSFGDKIAAAFGEKPFILSGQKKASLKVEAQEDVEIKVSQDELKQAFQDVLKRLPDSGILKKEKVKARLEMQEIVERVRQGLTQGKKASFFGIARGMNKGELILAFLAVLELVKKAEANLRQKSTWEDISIMPL